LKTRSHGNPLYRPKTIVRLRGKVRSNSWRPPAELIDVNSWVTVAAVSIDGTEAHLAIHPVTRALIGFDDLTSGWLLDVALSGWDELDGVRVAFVLQEHDPYSVVVFPGARNPHTGMVKPEILAHIKQLDSYAEITSFPTGIAVFVKARLPRLLMLSPDVILIGWNDYIPITGDRLADTPESINERQEQIDRLIEQVVWES